MKSAFVLLQVVLYTLQEELTETHLLSEHFRSLSEKILALFYRGVNVLLFFGRSHFHNPDDQQDYHQYADWRPKPHPSTHPAISPAIHMIHQ